LNHFDIWKLLAGLGIFLFGIYLMEESIKGLAGRSFKRMIRRYTSTRASAILTGASTTAILQSSSAISLMILAFVGAGIMSLENAIGVVLGSNIGTTVTAWIVAFFGFKVSIESFALPLIGIGGLGMILFSGKPVFYNLGKLFIGFGFLFHGLDFMKLSVEQLAAQFDITAITGLGLWVFILAGILLTALMQSSSATIAIVLSAIYAGVIGLSAGAAMVIGANVGTTTTVILGAIGGVPNKKRVAYSHLIFNLVTAAVALLLLPLLVWFIETGIGWRNQAVMGIALFHTLFNLIGVLLFLPFVPRLTGAVSRMFPEPEHMFTHYIQNTSPAIVDAAVAAFRKEVIHLYKEARNFLVLLFELEELEPLEHSTPSPHDQTFTGTSERFYLRIKELHGEIFEYYAKINAGELTKDESRELDQYLRAGRSIMNSVKNLKDIHADLLEFELSDRAILSESHLAFSRRLRELLASLDRVIDLDVDAGIESDAVYRKREERQEPTLNKSEAGSVLDETFEAIEEHDAGYITESSHAIRQGELEDVEATSLLMVNRLFTQSCRMIVFSLRGLLLGEEYKTDEDSDDPNAGGRLKTRESKKSMIDQR